jgi:Tol biopolymer transport system component
MAGVLLGTTVLSGLVHGAQATPPRSVGAAPATASGEGSASPLHFEVQDTVVAKARPNVRWNSMRLGPDGQHFAYTTIKGGGMSLTNALLATAFLSKAGTVRMVQDEVEGPAYGGVGEPVFSPDGRHMAYAALGGTHWESLGGAIGSRWQTVVVDGDQGRPYEMVTDPVFSADSSHVAYGGCRGSDVRNRECFLVVDGMERPTPERIQLSRDFYNVRLSDIALSPDGSRLAYFATRGEEPVVVNGTEITPAPGFDRQSLTFSPDGRHLVYVRRDRHEQRLVLDGVEGPSYREVGRPVFGPDGRLVYPIREGKTTFVEVQPEGGRRGPHRSPYSLAWVKVVLSPDGKRLAYTAWDGRKEFVVVDGSEGPRYDDISSPSFSPDSSRVAYFARLGKKSVLVVDGVETPSCATTSTRFVAPDLLSCIVRNGDEIVRREVRIVSAPRP